ncbi:hypothetical protein IR141_09655 [Neisseria sp. 19428wB4_WF04]|nr:hypothetical protein [Neisseria sp. 19428wB4_WF04]
MQIIKAEAIQPCFQVFKAFAIVVKSRIFRQPLMIAAASKVSCDISNPTAFLIISLTIQKLITLKPEPAVWL